MLIKKNLMASVSVAFVLTIGVASGLTVCADVFDNTSSADYSTTDTSSYYNSSSSLSNNVATTVDLNSTSSTNSIDINSDISIAEDITSSQEMSSAAPVATVSTVSDSGSSATDTKSLAKKWIAVPIVVLLGTLYLLIAYNVNEHRKVKRKKQLEAVALYKQGAHGKNDNLYDEDDYDDEYDDYDQEPLAGQALGGQQGGYDDHASRQVFDSEDFAGLNIVNKSRRNIEVDFDRDVYSNNVNNDTPSVNESTVPPHKPFDVPDFPQTPFNHKRKSKIDVDIDDDIYLDDDQDN